MAEGWQAFVRQTVEQPMADWERIVLRTDPSERRAGLDVYLNILRAVGINISNPGPVKTYGGGPPAHLEEFLATYIERVEKLRNDKELIGMDSSVMEAYFLLSKRLSVYKGSGLPFEFLETPVPGYKNEKMIQDMLKRYPELNSVITGHALPPRRSQPLLKNLVPSRAQKTGGEEESLRRPNRPRQHA